MAHILVVDDHADTAESLRELLGLLGYSVDVASDGPAALDAVRQRTPDIVVCDLGLPGMDGYAVAREIRRLSAVPIRMIAVSGYGREQDRREAIAAGFDVHMTKPIDFGELERAVAQQPAH